jgi:hypothetical protein
MNVKECLGVVSVIAELIQGMQKTINLKIGMKMATS